MVSNLALYLAGAQSSGRHSGNCLAYLSVQHLDSTLMLMARHSVLISLWRHPFTVWFPRILPAGVNSSPGSNMPTISNQCPLQARSLFTAVLEITTLRPPSISVSGEEVFPLPGSLFDVVTWPGGELGPSFCILLLSLKDKLKVKLINIVPELPKAIVWSVSPPKTCPCKWRARKLAFPFLTSACFVQLCHWLCLMNLYVWPLLCWLPGPFLWNSFWTVPLWSFCTILDLDPGLLLWPCLLLNLHFSQSW